VDKPGTHLNPQANVHSDPIVRSRKLPLSGEVVAEEANTKVRELNSAPSIFWQQVGKQKPVAVAFVETCPRRRSGRPG